MQAGDVIGCPAGGPGTAHQLVNTGDEPLRYLAIDSQIDPEICEYPDSGKYNAYVGGDGGPKFRAIQRSANTLDYWDGEP